MTKKINDLPVVPDVAVVATAPEVDSYTVALIDSHAAGEKNAHADILSRMLLAGDNIADALCHAIFTAGKDADGVLWLSHELVRHKVPTHQASAFVSLFRNTRKYTMSAIAPYRVVLRGF